MVDNDGDRASPRTVVLVAARDGAEAFATLPAIEPGLFVAVHVPLASPDGARAQVDPYGEVPETNEANNDRAYQPFDEGRTRVIEVSAAGAGWTAAALGALALALPRRRT